MKRFILAAALCLFIGVSALRAAGASPEWAWNKHFVFAGLSPDGAGTIDAARKSVADGQLDGAIQMLSAYVATHPQDVEAAKYLGDLYYRKADFKKAETVYRHVLDVVPTDAEAHNRLGGIYAAEDRVSDAIDQFTQSVP